MAKTTREPREISAHACAILSLLIGSGSLWMVFATYRAGGDWVFSVLACFVPLLFAIQGIRLSREPGTRFARFSFVGSVAGAVLGVISFGGFLVLLAR